MKAKRVQKRKYTLKKNKREKSKHSHEISGILLLALGVLMLISFYFKNSIGPFGIYLREISLGLIGFPSFVLPPLVIFFSILLIIKHDDINYGIRLVYGVLLLLIVSAIIQTGHYKAVDYANLSPIKTISKYYSDGITFDGGGVLGGLISLPFLMIFRTLGTIIVLTALALVDIILITNTSISQFIMNVKDLLFKKRDTKVVKNEKVKKIKDYLPLEDQEVKHEPVQKSKIIDFRLEKDFREQKEKGLDLKEHDHHEKVIEIKTHSTKSNDTKIPEIKVNDTRLSDSSLYKLPPHNLLKQDVEAGGNSKLYRNQILEGAKKLEETLASFGVSAKVINVTRGPTVTRYELQPSSGVKVSRIVNLSDDIALNLAASGVRIEAPIPGKAAIGIEVPNKETNSVLIREVLESEDFIKHPSKISFAIGKDISGECLIADIAKMPHLLIAGATGSGKSVCINSLIVSILYRATPDEVKLLLIDPKVVELGVYNGIPHLLIPVVTDPKKAAGALNWAVQEMVNRYKLFADKSVRDLKGYNELAKDDTEMTVLPQIVIVIDELADLMMVAPNDVEDAICRLAQMARAAGMHLVIATQRPSVDVITGIIKANIPSRISFAVSSQIDSRTILDMAGAEKLLGRGDMLFFPVGKPKPIRIQGPNITDAEVEKVVEFIKSQANASYDEDIIDEINNVDQDLNNSEGDNDELLPRVIEMIIEMDQASVSLIQRKFKVGYARAARIVDQMEARGIVGGYEGSKPRQILITKQQWQELKMTDKEFGE